MSDLLRVHPDVDRIDVEIRWGDGSVKRHVLVKSDGWSVNDDIKPTKTPNTYAQMMGRAYRPSTVALIGFLAAKLACHAPDDSAVKWAMEWLDARKR